MDILDDMRVSKLSEKVFLRVKVWLEPLNHDWHVAIHSLKCVFDHHLCAFSFLLLFNLCFSRQKHPSTPLLVRL